MKISHIQFADDTLFCANNESQLRFFLDIIRAFCGMSGLKINLEKSALLGINYEEDEMEVLADGIGCGREIWPINNLGISLERIRKVSFWKLVLSKMSRNLASWLKAFLSKGDRLNLIAAMLNAMVFHVSF